MLPHPLALVICAFGVSSPKSPVGLLSRRFPSMLEGSFVAWKFKKVFCLFVYIYFVGEGLCCGESVELKGQLVGARSPLPSHGSREPGSVRVVDH